jgi:hypothetical protein
MMNVYGLRIGKYKEGETIKISAAINDGIDRPRLRTAQHRLYNNIKPFITQGLDHPHLKDVVEWVEMMPKVKLLKLRSKRQC